MGNDEFVAVADPEGSVETGMPVAGIGVWEANWAVTEATTEKKLSFT